MSNDVRRKTKHNVESNHGIVASDGYQAVMGHDKRAAIGADKSDKESARLAGDCDGDNLVALALQ